MKYIFVALLFHFIGSAKGQEKVETLKLTEKHFSKTVEYKYHFATFYIDYESFKQFVSNQISIHVNDDTTYIKILRQTLAELKLISLNIDTIFISKNVIDSAEKHQIFEKFLSEEIEMNKCMIRDRNNAVQNKVIKWFVNDQEQNGIVVLGGAFFYLNDSKGQYLILKKPSIY